MATEAGTKMANILQNVDILKYIFFNEKYGILI